MNITIKPDRVRIRRCCRLSRLFEMRCLVDAFGLFPLSHLENRE
jgi:hypothetical protein